MKQKMRFKFGDKVHFRKNGKIKNGVIVSVSSLRAHNGHNEYEIMTQAKREECFIWSSNDRCECAIKKGWVK